LCEKKAGAKSDKTKAEKQHARKAFQHENATPNQRSSCRYLIPGSNERRLF
jgi:hypothetical protein